MERRKNSKKNVVGGFTLIEILLAMSLGSIVVLNLILLFASFNRNLTTQKALTELQSRIRFASYFLSDKIHLAGDASCVAGKLLSEPVIQGQEGENDTLKLGECIEYEGRRQWMQTQYFIEDTGRKNSHQEPILSLYLRVGNSHSEELVEGIKKLKITYGVMNQNKIHYLSANQITHWETVRSVIFQLTFQPLLLADNQLTKTINITSALRERQ